MCYDPRRQRRDGHRVDRTERAQQLPPRSAGSLRVRREPLGWPGDRCFRILSIDGGGIKGIFPAAVLAAIEDRYLGGSPAASCFDLIVGTSTGGIIALGLGAGLRAADILRLYLEDGRDIFPPAGFFKRQRRIVKSMYDPGNLERRLRRVLGQRTLGDSSARLCIPSCDGAHGDIWVFKTPHHPDYRMDGRRDMVEVALATAAAPTYFRPHDGGGYRLLDGGLWANNPIVIGLTEALTAFDVPRERVRILSLGCGTTPYRAGRWKTLLGGMLSWYDIIFGAMHYQSLGALGQARLLIGADRVIRIEPPPAEAAIRLDDWERAHAELPGAAADAVDEIGPEALDLFLAQAADRYRPAAGGGDELGAASAALRPMRRIQ